LAAMEVYEGLVIIEDKGALDCVIRARLQSAVLRACEAQPLRWEALK
ncbi:citrate lyase ACP, partial [Cronobacter sakazakii]